MNNNTNMAKKYIAEHYQDVFSARAKQLLLKKKAVTMKDTDEVVKVLMGDIQAKLTNDIHGLDPFFYSLAKSGLQSVDFFALARNIVLAEKNKL